MPRSLALLALAVVLGVLTWTTRAEATRRALVVGQDMGIGPDAPLRFAEDDARAVAAALSESGAALRDDVTLVTGADLAAVRAALRAVAARSQPEDELIFFFSGHGGPDGAHLDGQVWSWTDVRADLDAAHARLVVAFVDACFSGALLTPKGLVRESPLVVSVSRFDASAAADRGRGRYLVTSSGANELSYESGLIQGSPFAAALRSGMLGAADENHDGEVTLPELYDYIYGRTLSATVTAAAGAQHPVQSVSLESAGAVVLVQLRTGKGIAVRGSADLGRCYVLDSDGARVKAELDGGSEVVYLPKGDYVVKCVKGDAVMGAHTSLGAASSVSLGELLYSAETPTGQIAKGPGGASVSRFSLGAGVVSSTLAGALLLGYEGGSRDIVGAVEAGVSWRGGGLLAAGAAIEVPWWRLGGTSLALGLQAAATLQDLHATVALGGGSFVEVESARLFASSSTRGFARLDLLATHPVVGADATFGATLVGSLGVELGR